MGLNVNSDEKAKKVSIFESLTDEDINFLSKYAFADDELSSVLSLLELISDENKDTALSLIDSLFSGKKLVIDEDATSESSESFQHRTTVSERYTKMLLGNK